MGEQMVSQHSSSVAHVWWGYRRNPPQCEGGLSHDSVDILKSEFATLFVAESVPADLEGFWMSYRQNSQ
jgi:hypothetical protein